MTDGAVKFIDVCGQHRTGITYECIICHTKFVARLRTNRIEPKYCSRKCAYAGKSINNVKVSCAYCNKEFYKKPSSLINSKSKLYFCSRKCKDEAQKLGGIKEIMPPHFGTGLEKYRDKFKAEELYCRRCNYKEFLCSVHIHHIDEDRSNNVKENLIPLCANCHLALHNQLWELNEYFNNRSVTKIS